MAGRLAEPEPWVRVSEVLAEVMGLDERLVTEQAREVASQMRGIRYDWCGRPTCTWSAAEELRTSLKAEQARKRREIEEQQIEADRQFRASLPTGIPVSAVAGTGLSAAQLMMAVDPMDEGSKRRIGVVEHALANPDGALIFHPLRGEQADQ